MIIIQASNINSGGGAVLLNSFLQYLAPAMLQHPILLYIDERYQLPIPTGLQVQRVKPTLQSRFAVERSIQNNNEATRIICFGNLPLLFKHKAVVYLFFQNVLILDRAHGKLFSLKTRLKFLFERFWIGSGIRNVSKVYVQTKGVKNLFLQEFKNAPVTVFPFKENDLKIEAVDKKYDFIYVTSSDPHKNLNNLILAWEILRARGFQYTLCLTAHPRATEFKIKLNHLKDMIHIHENSSRKHLNDLMNQSKAIIFPSFCESFGLPLLEAVELNLPILASDLEYVYDVCRPEAIFDPHLPESIAGTVIKYKDHAFISSQKPSTFQEIHSTKDFVKEILK